MTNALSPAKISSSILDCPYFKSGTATDLGIDEARVQFNSAPRNVPLNMVVLTDGASNNDSWTIAAAHKLITMGVRTFSVGITANIKQQELLAIADGDASRVFNTDNFDELIKLLAPLSRKICAV